MSFLNYTIPSTLKLSKLFYLPTLPFSSSYFLIVFSVQASLSGIMTEVWQKMGAPSNMSAENYSSF